LAHGFHAVMTRQDLGGQDRVSGGQWFGDVAR
jgi:release factor glutamine methyltransferase